MTPRVSVVVPTYRRPELLERCIGALLFQEYRPSAYEIIVADDAAADATRRQVERLSGSVPELRIRYLAVTKTHGPAAARNAGWRAARGRIIAFTDDDCIPQPLWLAAGTAALVRGVVGACGRIVVPLPHSPTDYERDMSGLERAEFATANCFYRRDALEQVGGFDERFTAPWREDSDLYFTLLERGHCLVRAPDAVVVHPVRTAHWGVGLAQHRKVMFNALLYKKHPQLYRQRVQPAPPWHYYAIVATLLLAALAAVAGAWWLALIGAAGWALLTARFCLLRLRNTSTALGHIAEMVVTSILIPPLAIYWRLRGAIKFRVRFA